MAIYGTAILCACVIVGMCAGKMLALLCHMDDPKVNLGGVGFAMLLLILATDWLRKRSLLPSATESGIVFWSSIYIPVIVAMAASQNVRAAVHGGWAALAAGVLSVGCCVALVPLVCRIGRRKDSVEPLDP